jgi:hypothetical protein
MREIAGAASLRRPSVLPASSSYTNVIPVTFPPGRLMLATNPLSTGSLLVQATIGIEVVAFFANGATSPPSAKMTSGLR